MYPNTLILQNPGELLMQNLTYQDIDNIAQDVLDDFLKVNVTKFISIDIEKFATDYLGVKLEYINLSDNKNILGLTTFNKVIVELQRNHRVETICIPEDTILIEEELLHDVYNGRRRFTLSHECAHQILYRLDPSNNVYQQRFITGKTYSLRELTTTNDWCEWQANALGAALIMPHDLVLLALYRFGYTSSIKLYGNYLSIPDRQIVKTTASFLGVSQSALLIRMKQLKLTEQHSYINYKNPIDIII